MMPGNPRRCAGTRLSSTGGPAAGTGASSDASVRSESSPLSSSASPRASTPAVDDAAAAVTAAAPAPGAGATSPVSAMPPHAAEWLSRARSLVNRRSQPETLQANLRPPFDAVAASTTYSHSYKELALGGSTRERGAAVEIYSV